MEDERRLSQNENQIEDQGADQSGGKEKLTLGLELMTKRVYYFGEYCLQFI